MKASWQELSFQIDGDNAELASEILSALEAVSVTTRADQDEPDWLDLAEPVRPTWHKVNVTGLFDIEVDLDPVISCLVSEGLVSSADAVQRRLLQDQIWERQWMDQFKPFEVAPDLWIVPTHCPVPDDAQTFIRLDPGLAFGTGTHPTTALCLTAIASMDVTGQRVLDYGCGSGILAIAALKLGARDAVGVDVDPRALTASKENSAINGVTFQFVTCQPAELATDYRAELVIANILADTLVELSDELERRLAPNGSLLLSGILTHQVEDVVQRFGSGWRFEKSTCETWALLHGRRSD